MEKAYSSNCLSDILSSEQYAKDERKSERL